MKLVRLEVKGFKSFANETVLHFNEDVIGVVGPNGSGKSNVVDAIRWVLGEQSSRELRLERMTDVIFNGTKNRKEAGMAQVTLVFENNKGLLPLEYQQIAISRLLYRSGESEYRLNNVPCRLKDIRSLFLDTGVGSNSYAIIALGMVDDILADKDNARRRMFEQAAGISKYKTRKKETLSKLKSTSADLDRIEDLLFEIEGNLKSLESQARRTQRYLNMKEEYQVVSVQFAILSIKSLKEKYKAVELRLQEGQRQYREQETAITKLEAFIEALKTKNLEKEALLNTQQKELAAIIGKIRNLESEKALLKQRIEFKKSSADKLEETLASAKKERESMQLEIEAKSAHLKEEVKREKEWIQDKEKAEAYYHSVKEEYQQAKRLSDDLANRMQQLEREVFEVEKEIAITANNLENKRQVRKQQKNLLEERHLAFQAYEEELVKLSKQVELKNKEIQLAEEKEERREKDLIALRAQLEEDKNTFDKVSRRLDASINEYELLKSMIDNLEGFPESIKFLHQKWKKKPPILSDIIDAEDAYKGVIEQYLDSYLSYFVVSDVDVAAEAIRLLTNAQQGKANFFLLDKIPNDPISDVVVANTIPAISVVKVAPAYQPLLQYLLRDTYIFDGAMEDFKYLDTYQDYTFLSSSGTFLKRKASISGGSVGLFEGKKIGRKQNLEKLEKAIRKYDQEKTKYIGQISRLEDAIREAESRVATRNIKHLQEELKVLEQSVLKLQYKADEFSQFKARTEQRNNEIKEEISLLRQTIDDKKAYVKTLREQRKSLETSDTGDKLDMDTLSQKMSLASESFNAANVHLIRHQNLTATLKRDYEYKIARKEELENRIRQSKEQLAQDVSDTKTMETELAKNENGLLLAYDNRKEFDQALSQAEQDYYTARNQINEEEEKLRQMQRHRNTLQSSVQQLRDDFTGLKFQINAVGDRLKIEFDIQLNDIINQEVDPSWEQDKLEEKVEKLKKRLHNFGEINPLAVEAFNEMKERYDSIKSQRGDILQAKESLMETIKEIEDTATAKFLASFESVRLNFIEVFRSLFTEEDNCNLILLDPENPLDSDIEIIAKPKGKKPVSLSQLSGGEKTLTATALLFALYLLKPAPFCIFDEVDAPLDDANIQKFNKIVKKFSKDSQFIIVTHNKSTMAAVDVLYGVYMQEQGVSGVSPVDFRKYKHEEILGTAN